MDRKKKNLLYRENKYEEQTRLLMDCNIKALEGDENERKFELSFASEEPYKRWFGVEILENTENAVDLTRLNEIGVVLFNHDRDKVLGKVLRAWCEDGRCKAEIEFDADEKTEVIYQKVKSGTLKGVSVGYAVTVWEEVEAGEKSSDGRFEGPCSIAKKWMPFEISIVSVPADATVGIGRELEAVSESGVKAGNLEAYERQITINKNYL